VKPFLGNLCNWAAKAGRGVEINRLSTNKQAIKLFIKKLHDVFHKKLQKLGLVSPRAHMRA
jgi:hypothetical protein